MSSPASIGRRAKRPALLLVHEDPGDGRRRAPLYQRIAARIRDAVLSGEIAPGEALPSTRQLAEDIGCSRNPVIAAVETLIAEGYVESRWGSGVYVAQTLPETLLRARVPAAGATAADDDGARAEGVARASGRGKSGGEAYPGLSAFGERLGRTRAARAKASGGFPHQPDVSTFPFALWSRLVRETWGSVGGAVGGSGAGASGSADRAAAEAGLIREEDPAGCASLRAAIARHLSLWRGLDCTGDDVFITSGITPALHLVVQLLMNEGDEALVEEPGFLQAKAALGAVGARITALPVDEEGILIERFAQARKRSKRAPPKLACVTPSHQHPLGHVMSLARRRALIEWANDAGAYIVEDDHDAEIRYSGLPLAPLKSLDRADRVIYLGTFSKTLFDALRIGYMIAPRALRPAILAARRRIDLCPPILQQPVLARFIDEGHFAAYVRKMRKRYEKKRAALVDALHARLVGRMAVAPDGGGTHLVLGFVDPDPPAGGEKPLDARLADLLAEEGVGVVPLSAYYHGRPDRLGLVLGYGATEETDFAALTDEIARALDRL